MKQYTLLTNSGINKLLKTASDGSKIALKEIVVSDYDGELSEQATSIPNEKYRGAINAVTIDESDSNILDVDAIIPPEVGGFYIKTAGIYCDDGSLFAVARLADTYKPLLNEGSSKDITLNFKLQIANANESIILKVDNNVVLATRKWSNATFLKKIDAYTKQESNSKFLKIGDYGLGGRDNMPFLQNIDDTTTPTGFYRAVENQTSGTFPSAFGKSIHANVLVERLDGNWIKQTLTNIGTDTRTFIRTNNFSAKKWNDWQEVLMGAKNSTSSANSVVQRDANGDFAGRWIMADHFLMRTNAQDNILDANSEICFRMQQASENSPSHMRFATLAKFKEALGLSRGSVGASGWVGLPMGLILQWGQIQNLGVGEKREIMFPIVFPNWTLSVVATPGLPSPNNAISSLHVNGFFKEKFTIQNTDADSIYPAYWIAIGY